MPGEDRRRERRSRDLAVLDDEDVLAGAVGDEPVGGEQDRLVVAGTVRLGDREHRVQVDAGRLGGVRNRVRAHALPGRDLHADAVLQPLVAEVGAPGPAHDHDVDRVPGRGDAELAVAGERDRPQVALGQPVGADQLHARGVQLVDRVRQVHVQEIRRVVQPLEVVGQPEDGRALVGLVAANALEDAGAVVEPVGADVNRCVGPVDELTVHPDLVGLAHAPASLAKSVKGYVAASTASIGCALARRTRSADESTAMWLGEPAPTQTRLCGKEAVVDEHAVDARERERRDGARGEAGRALHLFGRRDPRRVGTPAAEAILLGSARRSPGTSATTQRPRSRRRATSRSAPACSPRRGQPRPPSACRSGTPRCAPRRPSGAGRPRRARRLPARGAPRCRQS